MPKLRSVIFFFGFAAIVYTLNCLVDVSFGYPIAWFNNFLRLGVYVFLFWLVVFFTSRKAEK